MTLQQAYNHKITQQHDIRTSDQLYCSQARLYALCCHPYGGKRPLVTATTAAMLIYSYRCLRDTSFTFRIIGQLVRNLKAELLQILEEELLACEHAERFLWVLAMGGMAAEGKCERPWYVVNFRMMADGLGLWSWRQVKRVLEGILWMKELDGPGWKLWVETGGDMILDGGFGELPPF
jgi:Fungal specific transcription factor domain